MIKYAEVKRIRDTEFGQVRVLGHAKYLPTGGGGITFVSIEGIAPKPKAGWYYTYATDAFQATDPGVPPAPPEPVESIAFWFGILTDKERTDCTAATHGVDLPGVSFSPEADRWRLRLWYDLSLASAVELDAPETIWAINRMEQSGILGSGRAAEILG